MYRNFTFFLVPLCLLCASLSLAQTPVMWHFGEEEGLPGTKIFDLFQDSRGYIWVGTDVGLVRYDGYQFRLYTNAAQNGLSLTRIQEDQQGRLWTQSFIGKIFYLESDSLHLFEPWEEYGNGEEFERLLVDKQNRLWLLGKEVPIPQIYDLNTESWSSLEIPEGNMRFTWMIQHSPEQFFLLGPRWL